MPQKSRQVSIQGNNWYLSNHPDSHFIKNLIAAQSERERRYTLYNNELSVHHLAGETERRTLNSAAELRATLEETFRVTLPEAPELDAALQRLITQGSAWNRPSRAKAGCPWRWTTFSCSLGSAGGQPALPLTPFLQIPLSHSRYFPPSDQVN